MRFAPVLCILIILLSCSKSKLPAGIMEPSKMEVVFSDILKADIYTSEFIKKDSTKVPVLENIALQKKIFRVHNVSKESFYKSFDYYTRHPDLMNVILDSIIAKENRIKVKSQKIKEIKTDE